MIEKRPILDFITHLVLIVGIIIIALPIWVMFVGATHDGLRMLRVPLPLLPGDQFLVNLNQTLLGHLLLMLALLFLSLPMIIRLVFSFSFQLNSLAKLFFDKLF